MTDDPGEAERLTPAPPVPDRRRRALLKLAVVDVTPLRRHRDFRLLWIGQGLSFFGSMLTYVAIPYQVYALTGSSLMVGLLSAAELRSCATTRATASESRTTRRSARAAGTVGAR